MQFTFTQSVYECVSSSSTCWCLCVNQSTHWCHWLPALTHISRTCLCSYLQSCFIHGVNQSALLLLLKDITSSQVSKTWHLIVLPPFFSLFNGLNVEMTVPWWSNQASTKLCFWKWKITLILISIARLHKQDYLFLANSRMAKDLLFFL